MEHRIIDLHVHSTKSDGTFSPEELIYAAKDAGLSALALTDHDTMSGIKEAQTAADLLGIELIPGIELSTEYNGKEIHIVGLYINPDDPQLVTKTFEFRECRTHRNEMIVNALQKEGFSITMESLLAENSDRVITRANIARYLYEHGCVKSVKEAFDKYIGDGCRCYVGRFKITSTEAVTLIRQAGGAAILAHPLLYHMSSVSLQHMIDDLKAVGLDGIEAIYSTYSPGEEQLVKKIAAQNGLFMSGGSDFHGANKPAIHLGTGRGHLYIPYSVLDEIKGCLRGRRRNES